MYCQIFRVVYDLSSFIIFVSKMITDDTRLNAKVMIERTFYGSTSSTKTDSQHLKLFLVEDLQKATFRSQDK